MTQDNAEALLLLMGFKKASPYEKYRELQRVQAYNFEEYPNQLPMYFYYTPKIGTGLHIYPTDDPLGTFVLSINSVRHNELDAAQEFSHAMEQFPGKLYKSKRPQFASIGGSATIPTSPTDLMWEELPMRHLQGILAVIGEKLIGE